MPEPGNEADDYVGDDEIGGEGNRIAGARATAVVEHIVKSLVDDPELVDIDVSERPNNGVLIMIHAGPDDMGRLIGRRGRVIQSIRRVASAAGATEGVKVEVDTAD